MRHEVSLVGHWELNRKGAQYSGEAKVVDMSYTVQCGFRTEERGKARRERRNQAAKFGHII